MKNIILRVTEEEKKRIHNFAKQCGITVSDFIRRNTLERNPTFLNEDDRKQISELKTKLIELIRIGNLYHEQREQNRSFIDKVKTIIRKLS